MRTFLLALILCAPAFAQQTQLDFRNSVPPSTTPTSDVLSITQLDAIERGLKYNLAIIGGDLDVRMARAHRLQALSDLLPTLNIRPSVSEQQLNLAALGFAGFPGVPQIVGPFTVVDARAFATAPVFDIRNWRRYRAGAEDIKVAEFNYQDARDEVVLVITGIYLQTLTTQACIESSRAQVATAEALYKQAFDRKNAGAAPAIDSLRAEVEWKTEQQRLTAYQNQFEKQKLALQSAIGLPPGQRFTLADQMPYDPPPPGLSVESLLEVAYRQRPDYLAKQSQVRAAELRKEAAAAGRLPTFSVDANYGVNGPTVDQIHGTFGVAGTVNIPVYQGGRVKAEVLEADTQVQRRKSELDAMKSRIDADVRSALLDVQTAVLQIQVSKENIDLAQKQLEQSQDRFSAGITNNLEVVQAQQAVAGAQESYIANLLGFNAAKIAVARARGDAGKSIVEYLKGKRQ